MFSTGVFSNLFSSKTELRDLKFIFEIEKKLYKYQKVLLQKNEINCNILFMY